MDFGGDLGDVDGKLEESIRVVVDLLGDEILQEVWDVDLGDED